jgi:flagellar hook-length control protein FliK
MSLMASQEPESASALDTPVASLSPLGSDGALALSDAKAALVTAPPVDSVLLALPSLPQTSAICISPLDGQGLGPLRSQVAAPGTTQPGLDLAAGVSSGRPSPLPSGLVQPESGFDASLGASPKPLVFDPTSEMLISPGGTDKVSAPSPGLVPGVQNEAQPPGIQGGITGMAAAGGLVLPVPATKGLLVPTQGDLKPMLDLPASQAPRSAADQPKSWTDAVQVLESLVPSGQASTSMTGQTSTQTLNDPQASMLALKPAGALISTQAALAGQVRQDANVLATGLSGTAGLGTTTLPVPAFALSPQDAGIRLSDRPAKHLSGRFGLVGDGVYGLPMATTNPSDALFQVPSTSAAAASTTVAETVSYWASQGVQNASLQLDGFGDEPVEVRISVNGDMAQVDFRTNQPEVRQVIEGAASLLKDMLSSQGMQLAGMSIGTSGRGGSQDKGPKAPSDARKLTLAKPEVVEAARVRSANLSVGQSLDLFV